MKHIQTLNTRDMAKSLQNGGCGKEPRGLFRMEKRSRFFLCNPTLIRI